MELEKIRLKAMPGIIEQLVKPAEKIDGISIHHVAGLGDRSGENSSDSTSPISKIVDSILDMSIAMPTLNRLGEIVETNVAASAEKGKKG